MGLNHLNYFDYLNLDCLISRNQSLFFTMKKWADYLISKVRYNSENLISIAMRHQDTAFGITHGESVDRLTISSDIKNGLSYMTIYNGKNSWKKGHKIQTFSIRGIPYLRIDANKVKLDYLGDLPELLFVKSNSILESTLESSIQTKPPSISRGSLSKKSAEELPQELDLVPKIEPELIPESTVQSKPFTSMQLDDLQKQIDKLQNMFSNLTSFEFKSIKEITPKQFSKIMESKNQTKKLGVKIEYDLIQTLQNQNKKLDDMEKKLHNLEQIK